MPIPIILPEIAADFEGGTIAAWHKAVGDDVRKGEVIVDVETDKAVVEVEAEHAGILGDIRVPAGSTDVAVNTTIGILLQNGETIDDVAVDNDLSPGDSPPLVTPVTNAVAKSDPAPQSEQQTHPSSDRIFASPLARRMASERGVDLSLLTGRGPRGRILKADVEAAAREVGTSAQSARPAGRSGSYTSIPNNNVRKVIARRLTEAKQHIPHFYLTIDCDIDALLGTRRQVNNRFAAKKPGIKISVNDLVVKAAALALVDVPAANASWSEEAIRRYNDIDISVAVATDNGLITPVVRNADQLAIADISSTIKDLAKRANDGRLHPDEYRGGGFTISNLGMYGIKEFQAIINPPQSCILAVGAGEKRAVVRDDIIASATMMTCTLSVDHRSVDGAIGAEYLQAFKEYIENPALLFLDLS